MTKHYGLISLAEKDSPGRRNICEGQRPERPEPSRGPQAWSMAGEWV